MRVVIAPDKFKGSLTATEAAQAMADGAREVLPGGEIVLSPVADGGEGTLDVILQKVGGRVDASHVKGPLGSDVESRVLFLSDNKRLVEMASASGLQLVEPTGRTALTASSYGTGQSLRVAFQQSTPETQVVLAIGGSATTDGGTGAAVACGWRFLDADGSQLEPGGGALRRLSKIVPPDEEAVPAGVELVGGCDVASPLLGASGAARGFAAQKGASESEIGFLEEGLDVLAERIRIDLGLDVRSLQGGGAGGGMGAGLVAFFGGHLRSGFDLVAEIIELSSALRAADVVITGEGRIDHQTLAGKTVVGVARCAAEQGIPALAIAGAVELDRQQMEGAGLADWLDLSAREGQDRSLADPAGATRRGTSELLRRFTS